MNCNSLRSMEHFTFNNTMERSPMDWCHQHLPVALLVNFIPTLYLFYPQGCGSWFPNNNHQQQHQALWFDCHMLQRAWREYNRRKAQGASSAVLFYSEQEGNTTAGRHKAPQMLYPYHYTPFHVLNIESVTTAYRAFLIKFLINQVVKKLPDFLSVYKSQTSDLFRR